MIIEADFDTGNIIVESMSGNTAALAIRADSGASYYQWFYFQATAAVHTRRQFSIMNAGKASYPFAWPTYRVLASYDEVNWFRIPTRYENEQLYFEHEATYETVSYAFFVPYTAARREALLRDCAAAGVTLRTIGQSVQGRNLDAAIFGDEGRSVKKIWVIARQHAGEPMAEYAAEGIIRHLLDKTPAAQQLLSKATVYVLPNANPDGSTLGNLRANALGVDLNRAWDKPTPEGPEVTAVLNALDKTGVDFFLDLHGDETRPYIWIIEPGVPMSAETARLARWFVLEAARRNPEVQPPPVAIVGVDAGNLGMAVNYVAATYGCPAWTPELPFGETHMPDDDNDSLLAEGCLRFGRSCVEALNVMIG